MSEQDPETTQAAPDPQPEPLKFEPPNFDYIEHGEDLGDSETRER